jgi:hypothetical protein
MYQFSAILHYKTKIQMETMPQKTNEPPLKYSGALNVVVWSM